MTAGAARLRLILSMVIFGTLGLFTRYIPLPSSLIALVRGVLGAAFLWLLSRARGIPLSRKAIRRQLPLLCVSGGLVGLNWIFLFEGYRYTTVATATLCYYLAPVLVVLASPLLGERLTARKTLCALAALAGAVCLSGVLETGLPTAGEGRGILCALAAAVFYAIIMLLNQRIRGLTAYERTVVQLAAAAAVLLPYCLVSVEWKAVQLSAAGLVCLLVLGIFHTGFTYYLYFGSMEVLRAQSVALLSYIDPAVAVLVSVLLLRERMSFVEGAGATLILGAALISELPERRKAEERA